MAKKLSKLTVECMRDFVELKFRLLAIVVRLNHTWEPPFSGVIVPN